MVVRLNVESALTLNAPEISAGSMTLPQPFTTQTPTFNVASYTINADDNAANPGIYYAVSLVNTAGTAPTLPAALLGNSLTINSGDTTVDTTVALPGGAFNLNSNGNLIVGSQGTIDVSGRSQLFVDVLATIGGGNINLSSASGTIAIETGADLDVDDLADVGSINQNTAGTLSLSAATGGVTIAAGTLHGEGATATSGGSFTIDTNSLDASSTGSSMSYDQLASLLDASGFTTSWNIRARSGNIAMTGNSTTTETLANNVTISTDTGSIDVSGKIDAHGATGGNINLYAGENLILESSAVLDAHGATANANGQGGQIWLAASQEGDQEGTLSLNVGAQINVGADAVNSGDSGPVLGGSVTFSTSRNSAGTGVDLTVNGGTLASFLGGVTGESAWDGIVVVGNQTYNYNDANLILTPNTTVAASGGTQITQTVAFNSYLNDASSFMANQSGIWNALGADGNGVVGGTYNADSNTYSGGVLINVRPGIVVKNSGNITIEGDATNPNGIDLSGSAYAGSSLNTGDSQTLDGHFGQYDEPVVLAIRAGQNLNFGVYHGDSLTVSGAITLGSLSDGFTQYYNNGTAIVPLLWQRDRRRRPRPGAATLFDRATMGAYHGLSEGLGADSATYFLTAGADTNAADPLAVNLSSPGTMTVAGIPGGAANPTGPNGIPVTTDPLYCL